VWDASSGEEVKKLVGHTSSVRSVTFSTDGKHIVSGLSDNMVQVWGALSGEEVKKLVGHTS
jgi:WD40 repeat protein